MKALVTGCAGFIGSHLTESLLEDGVEVVGLDCVNDNYDTALKQSNLERARSWSGFDFSQVDLASAELVGFVEDVDTVFHLAGEPGTRSSWGERFERYLRNNVLATQRLLEAAVTVGGRRFVYASSSSVYGERATLPNSEAVLPSPFSPYGVTKLAGEHLCGLHHANHGLETVALRYFTAYGPRQRPDMAFHIFIAAALCGREIRVLGDGRQTRDFTFVDDVVAATRLAATCPGIDGGVFNIGGGTRASIVDALALISQLTGKRLEVRFDEAMGGDVRDTAADISRARAALGFAPTTELADGLKSEIDWIAAYAGGTGVN